MSMIEVDPKLFITCRLCLEELGQYQIVPKVQMQIKYCFEINVEPFDGLPQLICKKCESILSQYDGIKHMYQEKQSSFVEKMKKDANNEISNENASSSQEDSNSQQQQDTVSSTQHIDIVNKNNEGGRKEKPKRKSLSLKSKKPTSNEPESGTSQVNEVSADNQELQAVTVRAPTKVNTFWKNDYDRTFVCKICSKAYKDKRNVISHLNKHESILTQYPHVFNSHFEIAMNKVDRISNLTKTTEYVVCSKKKIIKSENALYYTVYNAKAKRDRSSSSSSDEDVVRVASKHKRQRLISENSNDTLILDGVNENTTSMIDLENQNVESVRDDSDNQISEGNIECVNIDSDSTSIQSDPVETTIKPQVPSISHQRRGGLTIFDIIAVCRDKYLKKYDTNENVPIFNTNMEIFLQHKVLSMGTKTVHKDLNSTGLLRYLEHKSLDINWLEGKNSLATIMIKTKLKDAADNNSNSPDNTGFKNITQIIKDHPSRDFIDIFESVIKKKPFKKSERRRGLSNTSIAVTTPSSSSILSSLLTTNDEIGNEEAVLVAHSSQETDKQNCTKILNANPVANPKQLHYKKLSASTSQENLPNSDETINLTEESHMPVITSTVSLAALVHKKRNENNPPTDNQVQPQNSGTETNFPRIKVKPVSELMPVNNSQQTQTSPVAMTNWNTTSLVSLPSNTNLVYVTNLPEYTSVAPQPPTVLCYPQRMCSVKRMDAAGSNKLPDCNEPPTRPVTHECVNMHTVELPNTKTNSPFRYFQKLLQVHNLVLLDSTATVPDLMIGLIKFTLGFQQDQHVPVSLCMTLYCEKNIFCIKVRDTAMKELDISKLSANWQWEVLKIFKGDIVGKLSGNALKHGLDMSSKVNYFISLLKSIVFTK